MNATGADCRLAVYGTLAPGRPNHHELADLSGHWISGRVRGRLRSSGWGAELGYPGIDLDPDGPEVEVELFESPDLPAHWGRLDEFEGPGYRRTTSSIVTANGELAASIYVLADDPASRGVGSPRSSPST